MSEYEPDLTDYLEYYEATEEHKWKILHQEIKNCVQQFYMKPLVLATHKAAYRAIDERLMELVAEGLIALPYTMGLTTTTTSGTITINFRFIENSNRYCLKVRLDNKDITIKRVEPAIVQHAGGIQSQNAQRDVAAPASDTPSAYSNNAATPAPIQPSSYINSFVPIDK